jgi:hypothetical protein
MHRKESTRQNFLSGETHSHCAAEAVEQTNHRLPPMSHIG